MMQAKHVVQCGLAVYQTDDNQAKPKRCLLLDRQVEKVLKKTGGEAAGDKFISAWPGQAHAVFNGRHPDGHTGVNFNDSLL
jgi:hypothetical protein